MVIQRLDERERYWCGVGNQCYTGCYMGLQLRTITSIIAVVFLCLLWSMPAAVHAEDKPFSLQVSPSPLVATIEPGKRRELELKIRNAGTKPESLKVALRSFKLDKDGEVVLGSEPPKEVKEWVEFKDSTFTIAPGEWFAQKITFNVPKDTGFSYGFMIVISRTSDPEPSPGKQALQGSVGVFALLNIDRPGAKRAFTIEEFRSERRLYEYLPGTFSFTLKNTGNTIVQPQGNVFIQRTSSGQPIAVLPLNEAGSYLLPDVSRSLSTSWQDGFPAYKLQKTADNAPEAKKLVWDWGNAEHFRFGRYVAKMVAVYNDGQRDVPVVAEVTFWVIPWKLLGLLLLLILVLAIGIAAIVRRVLGWSRSARQRKYAQ